MTYVYVNWWLLELIFLTWYLMGVLLDHRMLSMWWFTLEGCKQPWKKSSQTWRDWTWDCRSKWNIYCHKCIRSENLQLYMEEMHLCTYWKCYFYNHVGCRHGLAQWAVNMFQGELYGYANFIHQKKMIPASVNSGKI